MISQEVIDRILERVDIVDVISDYIHLKKAGRNFKACCPFHDEKTPSFVVSPDKQIFHCFGGCATGGNAINFVMRYEHMDFPDAVRVVAAKAGVEVPKQYEASGEEASLASQIYEVNLTTAEFYKNYLRGESGKSAFEYLEKRGIKPETIDSFMLGYSPDSWEAIKKYFEKKKVHIDLLRKAGLVIPSEKGKGDYDRFRNRIMFPIFSERGSVAGFGARVMDNSLPKYINSPETAVYNKSNTLYGLSFAKKSIRQKGYVVLVEGYLDVIVPHQAGVTNVVAASGTALTEKQVMMLRRQADTVVIVFDSDKAGESASLRGLDILISNKMNVKIAVLPKGEDPDSFTRKFGGEAFEKEIEKAKDLFDYKLALLTERLGAGNIGGIADEMLPTIMKVDSAVVQSDYLRRLAARLGVHETSLRHEMNKIAPDYSSTRAREEKTEEPKSYKTGELYLLGLAILDKKVFEKITLEIGLSAAFSDAGVKKVADALGYFYLGEKSEANAEKFIARMREDAESVSLITEAVAKAEIEGDRDKALDDCIVYLKKENRGEKLKGLLSKLKRAQETGNNEEIDALVGRINAIHKEKAV